MKIVELQQGDKETVSRAATVLMDAFREHSPHSWRDIESAIQEVSKSFDENRISRVAVDDSGAVLGWISGISEYRGNVWELYLLAVKPDVQMKGIGSALVADFEQRVIEKGGHTIELGTDDEDDRTSIAGVDLYPDVLEHLANIRNLKGHPYQFYQKLGYVITGVIPDANGFGKPDIIMTKRVGSK